MKTTREDVDHVITQFVYDLERQAAADSVRIDLLVKQVSVLETENAALKARLEFEKQKAQPEPVVSER